MSQQSEATVFPLCDAKSAPVDSAGLLKSVEAEFGMIPNLERKMATSPQLLEGYAKLWQLFGISSLREEEQQIVYLVANFENECNYCVAWHTMLARQTKLPKDEVERLREGRPMKNEKWGALQRFTTAMIGSRGNPLPVDLEGFFAAGYSSRQALDVVLGLAAKTMSNYTNGLAGTPLDKQVERYRWSKPSLRDNTQECQETDFV